MAGWDQALMPAFVMYVILQIPPTLMEVFSYYSRGGLVHFENRFDDNYNPLFQAERDHYIYTKRFCDRPTSDAAKAFYAYLDWSSATWDKNHLIWRRNQAKHRGEVSMARPYLYGPFIFNWPRKEWLRGDDACAFGGPCWGHGGEERAREEFAAAKEKGYTKAWHYQRATMRRIRKEQEAKAAAAAAAAQ